MKLLPFIAALLLVSTMGYAQRPCYASANSLVISTGYNPVTNTLLGSFDYDPMWKLIQAPADPPGWTSNIGGPAISIPISSSWMYAGNNSRYLNAYPTNAALTDNWVLSTTPYIYERKFCVCAPDTVGYADVTFNVALNADNWAELILEDMGGTQTTIVSQPYVYSTANFLSTPAIASLTLQLASGEYKLKLYHRNKLVAMGVNLDGTITSTSLLSDAACEPTGRIAGLIHNDANHDGILDPTDPAVANIAVALYDANDSLLEVTFTDNAGYYFFMDLEPADYKVKGEYFAGWTYLEPNGGDSIVSIQEITVHEIDFLRTDAVSGVTDHDLSDGLKIYPNPSKGLVTVESAYDSELEIEITDQRGRLVYKGSTKGSKSIINLYHLEEGLYFATLISDEMRTTQRIIIK